MNFLEFISNHGSPLSRDVGEYIFRQGDHDQSLYIVKDGLLKAYYVSDDGRENIKSFILPGDNIGSLTVGYARQPDQRC